MSEDKKSDAQAEEQPAAAEKKPAPKKAEEPVKKQPDIVDEEELDIEIERVSPKRGSSCGPVAWILFIVILALVAVFGGMKVKKERDEAAAKARQLREATYQAQQQTINDNIDRASKAAMEGNVEEAVQQLEKAREKWAEMASTANSARDTDKAQFAMERESDLEAVLAELEQYREQASDLQKRAEKLASEVDALEKERDEFNKKVNQRVLEIATAGDVGATGVEVGKPGTAGKAGAEEPATKTEEKAGADQEAPSASELSANALLDAGKPEASKEPKKEAKKTKQPAKKADEPVEKAAKPSREPESPGSTEPPLARAEKP